MREDGANHDSDQGKGIASLNCRVCAAKYQTSNVTYLTEPIDVFCEWVDRCAEENQDGEDEDDLE